MSEQRFYTPAVEAIINAAGEAAEKNRNETLNTGHIFIGLQKFLREMSSAKSFLLKTENCGAFINVYDPEIKVEDVVPIMKEDRWFLGGVDTGISCVNNNLVSCEYKGSGKNDPTYGELADRVLQLVDSYYIDGANFMYELKVANLSLDPEDFTKIIIDRDTDEMINRLKVLYKDNKYVQDVPDLIRVLFNDNTYELAKVFELLQGLSSGDPSKFKFRLPKEFTLTQLYSDFNDLANEFIKKFEVYHPLENTIESLDKFDTLSNLNLRMKKNPKIVLENEGNIEKIEVQLCSEKYRSIALVGPSGCGKTTIVEDLAQHINEGKCPDFLKDVLIYELSTTALVSNCKYVGEFEAKCRKIFEAVKTFKNVILFIDEGHMITNTGSSQGEGGGQTLGNIIKPYISRGDLTIITATTDGEYKHIEKDKAINRRFQKIAIQEPSDAVTRKILEGIVEHKEKMYSKTTSNVENLITYIINNGAKYFPNWANPDRSLFLLDGAYAYASQKELPEVNIDVLERYLSLMHGVTISKTKASDTRKALKERLFGQDKAIDRVYEDLKTCELGLVDPKAPLYSMIFSGPTGTGKTETCKLIAKYFFGNENNIVNINMSDYAQEFTVSNLLGSPKGYVGHGDDSNLVAKVKQNPHCVVVFDEIEKAHEKVFDIFLKILDEGEMEDDRGNKVSFKNAIIIFTSNLGFDHDSNRATGAGLVKMVTGTSNVKEALKDSFRPEFLGRVNDIVVYDYLTDDIISKLVGRITKEYLERANMPDEEITFNEEEMKEITKMANVKEEGARHLTQAVRRILTRKLMARESSLA